MYHHNHTQNPQATTVKADAKTVVGGFVGVVALPVLVMVAMAHTVLALVAVAGVVTPLVARRVSGRDRTARTRLGPARGTRSRRGRAVDTLRDARFGRR